MKVLVQVLHAEDVLWVHRVECQAHSLLGQYWGEEIGAVVELIPPLAEEQLRVHFDLNCIKDLGHQRGIGQPIPCVEVGKLFVTHLRDCLVDGQSADGLDELMSVYY